MSLLQRLTRTLRPTPLCTKTSATKPLSSNYFSPHSLHRVGLRQRFYSSHNNHEHNYALNQNLLYGLMGLNIGIFGYSVYLQVQAKQGFQDPAVNFLRNMTLNYDEVFREGKWWTIITCVFMHSGILHLGFNMVSTYVLGGMVASIPGMTPLRLLTIVLGSGLSGSVGHLYLRAHQLKEAKTKYGYRVPDTRRGLGFSGAVTGLGVVAAFVYPRVKMAIYGIIPAPLWVLMLGFIVWDGYFVNDEKSNVGHAGHLGGAAFGAFYYLSRMRGLRL
ncbi:rhomboid-domain-containing protein [Lentithecium fluviatile CBS 122367]|uniref:Rhomboid-domain-containing protein n=1 Tax=Lentithecium fluviatile CBS 122367 TaxID=1168545 RepID=A0A6G1J4R5_9PLEO|nr:rhomboid-domain-containing protein [Lentithecium fluviatile CBS 122367]